MDKYISFLITTVFVLILALFITGCQTQPLVVTKTVYKPIGINEELTKKVSPTPPPNKEDYIVATKDARINMLNKLTMSLYGDLAMCNQRLTKINELNKELIFFVEKKNTEVQK